MLSYSISKTRYARPQGFGAHDNHRLSVASGAGAVIDESVGSSVARGTKRAAGEDEQQMMGACEDALSSEDAPRGEVALGREAKEEKGSSNDRLSPVTLSRSLIHLSIDSRLTASPSPDPSVNHVPPDKEGRIQALSSLSRDI